MLRTYKKYNFSNISFDKLMQKRILKVLLVCSTYDAFILEEDGRIDEQIFNEYVSLNLRYPPQFIQVSTAKKTFEVLEKEDINLIITVLSTVDMEYFKLANKIKKNFPEIPIVVLTPFSRERTIRFAKEDLSSIDYVFSWLGNTNLLLAIIKLIEDAMNIENDVKDVGVQAILLVEDSIRFYSSYLPIMYQIILEQSLTFTTEGLNEHQKMMLKRGRPKILLATNYDQAIDLFNKYEKNLLGVISDVSYKRNGKRDKKAGIKFCRKIKEKNSLMPILLQSSDNENKITARHLNVSFIDKNSKKLLHELRHYIRKYFAFGDFIVINPDNSQGIMQISNLKTLQEKIYSIPDNSLNYHLQRNHFSKWLNARAMFNIADFIRNHSLNEFTDLEHVRKFIYDSIEAFRLYKSKGVIAKFYRDSYDKYLTFTRIGDGSLGGKARGLAFLDLMINNHAELNNYENINISIPLTVVLTTDVFDGFMQQNNLYEIALSDTSDTLILETFLKAKIPTTYQDDLKAFVEVIDSPIAVRSSSLLEDSQYQPFAGIYSTYMIPATYNKKRVLEMLLIAIKSVFASVYFNESKAYMTATSNVIDEEKMAIVLQEICGTRYNNRFYPTLSGVGRSINFYPIEPEKPEEGIVNIALGLGKQIVDGGKSLRFSPKHPKKILQLTDAKTALRETQKKFFALDLDSDKFIASTYDSENLIKLRIKDAEKDGSIDLISSVYDFEYDTLKDGKHYEGKKVITFNNILKYDAIPLAKILTQVLKIGQKEMNNPIEIEFAVVIPIDKNKNIIFNLLQIRPIVETSSTITDNLEKIKPEEETIIYSKSALGNGVIKNIYDLIYIKPETFDSIHNEKIAEKIGELNQMFIENDKNYVLVGPGRWGSRDKWLGIPVKWSQISAARVIVEAGLENYRIDPSQGTHFFQNLTSFRVGYFTINPYIKDGFYNLEYLAKQPAVYKDELIRHIHFEKPIIVKIDGKKKIGVVLL